MTPEQAGEQIQQAIEHIRGRDLPAAEQKLMAVLRAHPNHPDALHYLGVVALQVGQTHKAIELISASLSRARNFAAFTNLGHALRSAGQLDQAIACYDQAIGLEPRQPDAYMPLALLLLQQGKKEIALRVLQKLVQVRSNDTQAHLMLGTLYSELEYLEKSVSAFRAHIAIQPDSAEAHGRLSMSLSKLKRHEEAVAEARRAVELAPQLPDAWNNLGWCLDRAGKTGEALEAYRKAVSLNPNYVLALGNLGALLERQDHLDEAIELFEQARRADPKHVEALNTLAGLYSKTGRYEEALAASEQALAANPRDASAHGHRALALLSFGKYEEGFKEYEWRWECKDFTTPARDFPQPRWTGATDPAGRTILVHCEQGYGDNIQFARFLPLLSDRGATVLVECPVALCGLMEGLRGVSRVIATGVRPPSFELQAPLLSLPHAFGTTLDNIPRDVPYFAVQSSRGEKWRQRLAPQLGQFNVGLVWRGNTKPNPRRSIPLAELAPLARVQGVTFVSLQFGAQGIEADAPPAGMRLVDLRNELKDFLDSAAVISQLDLVITIDTAAAHLAGALGVPTWTMLIFSADWRWLHHREDSPWYPTMRLFRQSRLDRWDDVVARVADELHRRVR